MATTTPVRKTRPGRKVHRLAAAVALMAGSAAWASPAADAGGPPPTLQFTVSPDEFVVDATFDVTIEGTGCVDPAGPSAEPLVVAFWIKGGGVGSAPVDFHLGDFEVNPDGSFSETVEVDMALSRFRLEDPQGAAVVEGICADSWFPSSPEAVLASAEVTISIVRSDDYVAPTTSTSVIGVLPTLPGSTVPADPDGTPTAPPATQVQAQPTYTG